MHYFEAFAYPFRGPRWGMNLLYGGLCMLIPIIGPVVFLGYLGSVVDLLLKDRRSDPPEFDFGRFVAYLERGVWPFLVYLILSLAMIPVFAVAAVPLLAIPIGDLEGPARLVPIVLTVILAVIGVAFLTVVTLALGFRALLTRDLARALSFGFASDFLGRVGWDTILALIVLWLMSLPIALAGYACCFIGVYPAIAIIYIAQTHVMTQLYQLYLQRGGTPVGGAAEDALGLA